MTDDNGSANSNGKSKHGFASWDLEKRTRVAAKGGRAAHAAGTAHQFTSAEAKAAGRKGGIAVHAKNKERALAAPGAFEGGSGAKVPPKEEPTS